MEKRRQKILKHYLNSQNKTLQEIADELDVDKSVVSSVVSEHINNIRIYKEFGFCFSLYFPEKLGYFYDDTSERKVVLENNEIINKEDFNEYELFWLKINYNLGYFIEKKPLLTDKEMLINDLKHRLENGRNPAEKSNLKRKLKIVKSI